MNADCYFGDHLWSGTSQCFRCGARLRCACGCYVREDRIDEHVRSCSWYEAAEREERRQIEAGWL